MSSSNTDSTMLDYEHTESGPGSVPPAGVPPAASATGQRRRRWPLVVTAVVASTTVALSAVAVGVYFKARSLPNNVSRISGSFEGIAEEQRPAKPAHAQRSMTFLVVGTDSRAPRRVADADAAELAIKPGTTNSDAIMLVHIAANRGNATVISVPRDSLVAVPGKESMRLRRAYYAGGPSLLVRTVEQLTASRVDHFAVLDFAGFKSIIDTVGGVDLPMEKATTVGTKRYRAGVNHLSGSQALTYVREIDTLPNGDLDRVRRHQVLVKAMMSSVAKMNPATNPVKMYNLVDTMSRALSVDDSLTNDKLRTLATSLVGLRGDRVSFLTAPTRGVGTLGAQNVVYLDDAKCSGLWTAVRNDTVSRYSVALAQ
ncbi:MAG: LCP family protein [Micromonosporaceae bacterium]|nr:LCP family protein [Micromonosporaceae bacterium]